MRLPREWLLAWFERWPEHAFGASLLLYLVFGVVVGMTVTLAFGLAAQLARRFAAGGD